MLEFFILYLKKKKKKSLFVNYLILNPINRTKKAIKKEIFYTSVANYCCVTV